MALRAIIHRLSALPVANGIQPIVIQTAAALHSSARLCKAEDRRQMKASLPAKDEGTIGERTANIDSILFK